MGLVVHVTSTKYREAEAKYQAYPFEVDEGESIETVEELRDRMDAGVPVLGRRLWLERPVPPCNLGLLPSQDRSIPNLVRVVFREDEMWLTWSMVKHIEPWRAGRVVRIEGG